MTTYTLPQNPGNRTRETYVDLGRSAGYLRDYGAHYEPVHAKTAPTPIRDAWSGNPDTDKYWSK